MNMPFHTVATPVVIAKASKPLPEFCPYAVMDWNRFSARAAMLKELELADLWKASAAAENHRKGVPHSDPAGLGTLKSKNVITPSSDTQARILGAIADTSANITTIMAKTGLSKSSVAHATKWLTDAGTLIEVKGLGRTATEYHQPGWQPTREIIIRGHGRADQHRDIMARIAIITEAMRGREITQTEIARASGQHRNTVNRALRRMEDMGTAVLVSGRIGTAFVWRLAE